MPRFDLTDAAIEALASWLVLSGFAWLALAAYRARTQGLDRSNVLLVVAALVGWLGVVRLTTGVLGQELVSLDLVRMVWGGLPVYVVFAGLLLAALLLHAAARRSWLALAAALVALVGAPAIGLPLLGGGVDDVTLLSDPLPRNLAEPPPATPITDPERPGMVYVPAGPFLLGTLNPEQLRPIIGNTDGDEQPVRTIYLDAFYIDRLEVTNREFSEFVSSTDHVTDAERRGTGLVWGPNGWYFQTEAQWRHPMGPGDSIVGLDDHPVVQVSWNDARAFCAWTGKRLATEAEWEKAARGVDARDYPWGPGFDASKLNYCDRGCDQHHHDPTATDGFPRTAPVGSFPAGVSPYGALDMVGNVWEFVEDWYDPDYYRRAPSANPRGPDEGTHRVVRGGSWVSEKEFTRVTSRSFDPPTYSYFGVGIRCASDP